MSQTTRFMNTVVPSAETLQFSISGPFVSTSTSRNDLTVEAEMWSVSFPE